MIEFSKLKPHPNIVLFRGMTTNPFCLVFDYCEGGSLENYINGNHGKISLNQKLSWSSDIANGMTHLHFGLNGQEIIHRDLASRNILVLLFCEVDKDEVG